MAAPIYTNADTNMTTTVGLAPGMQTYYDRELLENFRSTLVYTNYGDEKIIPMHSGKTIDMRKVTPLPTDTTALSEGNPGDAEMFAETNITATIEQYGKWTRYTDLLDMTHLDMRLETYRQELGDQLARSIDAVACEELMGGDNVIYAGGKTGRAQLAATDKLSSIELRKAVKMLKKNKAPKFDGYYIAIVGPDTWYDLQDDPDWKAVSHYQDKENVYTGEVGRLFGCRIVETEEAKIFEGEGSSSADVAGVLVLGRHAYGISSVGGKSAPHMIVKPLGSGGPNDPLNQIGTVGCKVDSFVVKRLAEECMVRIECGFSA